MRLLRRVNKLTQRNKSKGSHTHTHTGQRCVFVATEERVHAVCVCVWVHVRVFLASNLQLSCFLFNKFRGDFLQVLLHDV